MAILIAQYIGDRLVRRCDAGCYDGQTLTQCTCICGGRFHGKGFARAQHELLTEWRQWAEEEGFVIPTEQLALPEVP